MKTEPVDELAMQHTAMVIRDVGADVMGVVEAESRPTLRLFTEAMLVAREHHSLGVGVVDVRPDLGERIATPGEDADVDPALVVAVDVSNTGLGSGRVLMQAV